MHLGWPVLFGQRALHPAHALDDAGGDEVFRLFAAGEVDQPGQTLFPQARPGIAGQPAAVHVVLQADFVMALDHQCPPHAQRRDDHDDGERQRAGDRHGL